jgi:hypothetical protein
VKESGIEELSKREVHVEMMVLVFATAQQATMVQGGRWKPREGNLGKLGHERI